MLGPWQRTFTAGVRWSPDSTQLVLEVVQKVGPAVDADISGVTLVRTRATGGPLHALTDPLLFAATADWSPDGRLITYSALPTSPPMLRTSS